MSIELRWKNINAPTGIISVYRSDFAVVDFPGDPGTELVNLPGDATGYLDETAVPGVNYYYAVRAFNSGLNAWSPVQNLTTIQFRGPGPQKIKLGDTRLGYFGPLNALELPNIADALNKRSVINDNTFNVVWHKFIRKNVIYFVKETPMFQANVFGVNGRDVRLSIGLDNGITWPFDASGWTDYGKGTVLSRNSYNYYIRAPRGMPDDWDGTYPSDSITTARALQTDTEFNELIIPMLTDSAIANKFGCIPGYKPEKTIANYVCAERYSAQNVLVRCVFSGGTFTGNSGLSTSFLSRTLNTGNSVGDTTNLGADNYVAFWPILVLKED